VVLNAPRVSLASWLVIFWTSYCLPTLPWEPSPFKFPPELRSEEGGCLDVCRLDQSAVLR